MSFQSRLCFVKGHWSDEMILSITASISTTTGSIMTQSHNTHSIPKVITAVPSSSWLCAALGHCFQQLRSCLKTPQVCCPRFPSVEEQRRGAALLLRGTRQVVLLSPKTTFTHWSDQYFKYPLSHNLLNRYKISRNPGDTVTEEYPGAGDT